MALTALQIQARIDAIRAARDTGVLQVSHSGTTTTFRNLDDMNKIIASLEAELALLTSTRKKRISYIQQDSKGL